MSICPTCKTRVRTKSGNARKVWGVWVHKSHKHIKPKEDDIPDVAFLPYRTDERISKPVQNGSSTDWPTVRQVVKTNFFGKTKTATIKGGRINE